MGSSKMQISTLVILELLGFIACGLLPVDHIVNNAKSTEILPTEIDLLGGVIQGIISLKWPHMTDTFDKTKQRLPPIADRPDDELNVNLNSRPKLTDVQIVDPAVSLTQDVGKFNSLHEMMPNTFNSDMMPLGGPLSLGHSYRLSQTINKLIDSILTIGLGQMDSQISVPDIHETAQQKVLFFDLRATFTAEKGTVENMRSLQRTGDSKMEKHGDTYSLETILGFQHLAVQFEKYILETLGISMDGSLIGKIAGNSFLLNVGIRKSSSECKLLLNAFKLIKLDRITVTMSGGNRITGWLQSRISTWIVNHFRDEIRHKLEARISAMLEETLHKHEKHICGLFK